MTRNSDGTLERPRAVLCAQLHDDFVRYSTLATGRSNRNATSGEIERSPNFIDTGVRRYGGANHLAIPESCERGAIRNAGNRGDHTLTIAGGTYGRRQIELVECSGIRRAK